LPEDALGGQVTHTIPAKDSARPAGIGGWLAFLIVWMVVLRPLAGIILLNQLKAASLENPAILENSNWLVNTSSFWIIFLIVAALSVYAGLRLWHEHSRAAVKMAIIALWIYSPVAAADLLIARAYLEGAVTWANVATTAASNLAIATVWTLYLLRSRRVRNTYYQRSI
jgi:hypothetical protein